MHVGALTFICLRDGVEWRGEGYSQSAFIAVMKDRHSNGTEAVYHSTLKSIIQWR